MRLKKQKSYVGFISPPLVFCDPCQTCLLVCVRVCVCVSMCWTNLPRWCDVGGDAKRTDSILALLKTMYVHNHVKVHLTY